MGSGIPCIPAEEHTCPEPDINQLFQEQRKGFGLWNLLPAGLKSPTTWGCKTGEDATVKLCSAAGKLWLHMGYMQPLQFSLGSFFPSCSSVLWGTWVGHGREVHPPNTHVLYLFRRNKINHPIPHSDSLSILVFGKLIILHVNNYPALISFSSLSWSVRQTSSNHFKVLEHPQRENLRPPSWGIWMNHETRCSMWSGHFPKEDGYCHVRCVLGKSRWQYCRVNWDKASQRMNNENPCCQGNCYPQDLQSCVIDLMTDFILTDFE